MGGEDGYYAFLLHELLHATGHPSRLDRVTAGDYSGEGTELEEGTVFLAQRIVLANRVLTRRARVVCADISRAPHRSGGCGTRSGVGPQLDLAGGGFHSTRVDNPAFLLTRACA